MDRLRRFLPALWAGAMLCVAAIATPAAFAMLDRTEAGRVAGRILMQEAWLSLVLAIVSMVLERGRARRRAEQGAGSVVSTEMLLVLGTVFCTVAGYFAIQPLMPAARLGQGRLTFSQLHLLSTLFFGAKLLMVLALGWRGAGHTPAPAQIDPLSPRPSS